MKDRERPTLAVRAAVERHYGDLKGRLLLNDMEAVALRETLAVYHFALMQSTQENFDDPVALLEAHRSLNNTLVERLTALLGAEKYAQFVAHRDGLTGSSS